METSAIPDHTIQNGNVIDDTSERSPRSVGEDEEAARLKELAADVQDQTDLERNIGRQVGIH